MCKAASDHFDVLDERPVDIRRAEEQSKTPAPPASTAGLVVEDLQVPVDGGSITVRSYRPSNDRPTPLHLFAHGGSYWSGNLDQVDPTARRYAWAAQCRVLSIDYRRAPEHTWPTAAEDYYAVLEWAVSGADELRIEVDRVSVGGVSCGGTLAAVATLMARDRSGPAIMFQMLEIPGLDMTMSQPSLRQLASGYIVTYDALKQGNDYYLPPDVDRTQPYVSPLLADDLSGLPPATILTCEYDPLRDDGESYARRLREAGVEVELIRAAGHIHGSTYSPSRLLPSARRYQAKTAESLRRAYATA
jgi:acetyl esterase